MESSVEIREDELAQIVQVVFETMLNLEVWQCPVPWFPGPDRLIASVHLSGEWSGEVLLECDRRQAQSLAGRYLSIIPPDTMHEVVRDVLGELANMIGGNIKCVLMRGIQLSLPSVVEAGGDRPRRSRVGNLHHLSFQCAEGIFWVTAADA